MRFRSTLATVAVLGLAAGITPAHAEDELGFGTKLYDDRVNDGFHGYIRLVFGPNLGATADAPDPTRPVSADCNWQLQGEPNTGRQTLIIQAHAEAGVGSTGFYPASVGVKCVVTINGVFAGSAEGATPGGATSQQATWAHIAPGIPVTACSYPTVHWSDNKVTNDNNVTGFCKSSS